LRGITRKETEEARGGITQLSYSSTSYGNIKGGSGSKEYTRRERWEGLRSGRETTIEAGLPHGKNK